MTRARRMPLLALVAAALCAISVLTGSAHAAFPDRPIRLIASFPPGGASDGVAHAAVLCLVRDAGRHECTVVGATESGGRAVRSARSM